MTMKRKDMYYMMNSSKASIVATFGSMPPGQMEHWRITHRTIAKKNGTICFQTADGWETEFN